MYNGIGLMTPRGSGTSGHVTKNMAHVRPEFFRNKVESNSGKARSHGNHLFTSGSGAVGNNGGVGNRDILDHNRQRQIEGQLFELQEALIEQGRTDAEIESLIANKRRDLASGMTGTISSSSSISLRKGSGSSNGHDSHAAAKGIQDELSRARSAFRIKGDFKPGERFDAEAQERKRRAGIEEGQEREDRRDRSRSRDRAAPR